MDERKVWIHNEIESKRIELKSIVGQSLDQLHREDIVKISQELDLLINKFYSIMKVSTYSA